MFNIGGISVSGKSINSRQLQVSFVGLPGTSPHQLGHFIAVWEGKNMLNQTEAIFTQLITTSISSGDIIIQDLAIGERDYVIGYGVNGYGGMDTFCAMLTLSKSAKAGDVLPAYLSSVFVNQDAIGTDSLIAQLSAPFSHQNKSSYKWIALFHGEFNEQIYTGSNVVAVSKCFVPQTCTSIFMNHIPERLARYETYTLIHGVGLNHHGQPDYARLNSYHTFIVWKSNLYIGTRNVDSLLSKSKFLP